MDVDEQPSQMYANPLQSYNSSIIFMTSPDDDLRAMELSLRGLKENSEGKLNKVGDALLNDEGINKVIMIVRSIVSRSTYMNNINKHIVPNLIDYMSDVLAKTLMINPAKFNIKSVSARDEIMLVAQNNAFVALCRGLDEGERRFWGKSFQEITTKVDGGNKGNGFFNKILGWGR